MKKLVFAIALFALTASVAAGSCTVSPPEGQMECSSSQDCPDNWYCNIEGDGLCYSTAPDDDQDAGEPDAS